MSVWWAVLWLGCGGQGAWPGDALGVAAPTGQTRESAWELQLLGVPIGAELRLDGLGASGDRRVARYRRYALQRGGQRLSLEASSAGELDSEGGLLRWQWALGEAWREAELVGDAWVERDGRGTSALVQTSPADGAPLAPELLGAAELGAWAERPRDAWLGQGKWTPGLVIHATAQGFAFDGPQGEVRVTVAEGEVARWESGPLALVRVPAFVVPPARDPAEVLAVPTGPLRRARESVVLEGRLGGLVLNERRPLVAELALQDASGGPGWPVVVRGLLGSLAGRLRAAPSPGAPDAMQALIRGEGDCNEWAEVFAKEAREAGLEARTVAGMVWVARPPGGAFVPHAWVEVRSELGWIPVDPILGQVIADATHVKLVDGALGADFLHLWPRGDLVVTALR